MQPQNVLIQELQLKEFYQLVGQCIKAWATVDDKLFDICERLLKTERQFVSVIFFRLFGTGSRIELTNELLAIRFPSSKVKDKEVDHPDFATWKDIKTEITRLLPDRNSLAHDPVKINISPEHSPASGLRQSFATGTSEKEKLRGKKQREVAHTELSRHLENVNAVSERLVKFISSTLV
jgi:hypothetical protein